MSLQDTPSANRVHIGMFGRRNAGKSSLINALTGQELAIVSDIAGTTTDPVSKSMELLPLGPVLLIDTAGLDDDSPLGAQRVRKSLAVLDKTDIALLVVDRDTPLQAREQELLARLERQDIPYLVVRNKRDLLPGPPADGGKREMWVSAATGENIHALRERIARLAPPPPPAAPLIADLLAPDDRVVLVVPIDSAAPKGRLILPQQQTIRDILEAGAQAVVTREDGLPHTLAGLTGPPRMVVTDSQVFHRVAADTPPEIPLTSFSILFARHKGFLMQAVRGLEALDALRDGNRILISEGCTHHRQCEDIGTVKLPRWIAEFTGRELEYQWSCGGGFPADLSPFRLIVHCGACMLPERAVLARFAAARAQGVPITNFGTLIAKIQGILDRSLQPFAQ